MQYWEEKILEVLAEIRTRSWWIRSGNATSGLCCLFQNIKTWVELNHTQIIPFWRESQFLENLAKTWPRAFVGPPRPRVYLRGDCNSTSWPLLDMNQWLNNLSVRNFNLKIRIFKGLSTIGVDSNAMFFCCREQRGLAVRRDVCQDRGADDRWWTHPCSGKSLAPAQRGISGTIWSDQPAKGVLCSVLYT